MNKIEELIRQLCPEGVEFKELGEVLEYEQPSKYIVESTNYHNAYETPVLTAGQTFILGYTDEKQGVYDASQDNPAIIFDDFTTSFHWVDFKFKVKSSAMKMLRPKKGADVTLRYIYFAMRCVEYYAQDHARQWISVYSKFQIPIPPLPVQQEIVNILDTFTQLEAELEAELEARKTQYEYYRNELLTFGDEVEWKTLGEVGRVCMCKRVMKNETTTTGDIPFYKIGTFGKTPDAYISKALYEDYKSRFSFPATGTILISASGTIGRTVIYDGKPAYFQDSNIVWINNNESIVTNKFLFHYYKIIKWKTDGGTISRLYNENFAKTKIPIPPLAEQERIVGILDKFDAIVNDITIGLPAEIEARRKQYEYYREKLLSFDRARNKEEKECAATIREQERDLFSFYENT